MKIKLELPKSLCKTEVSRARWEEVVNARRYVANILKD